MSTVLASAADARYGYWLMNLVGSVKANSDVFDRIVLYDLGLTPFQRRLAGRIRGVEIATVPPFVPHWRQGRTWKTWIWTHVEADALLWLDAGVTVLRRLDDPLDQIRRLGYFVVSSGHPLGVSVPPDYRTRYPLSQAQLEQDTPTAGIIGFAPGRDFYRHVIEPAFSDACEGLSVGVSRGEEGKFNQGLEKTDALVIRDCPLFRHEQTLLGIHFFRYLDNPVVNDVYRYGGWLSPRQHPEQLLWNHRRRGDYAYLPRVPYGAAFAPFGKTWGLLFRWRWWAKNHSWFFNPATYVRKAKALILAAPVRR